MCLQFNEKFINFSFSTVVHLMDFCFLYFFEYLNKKQLSCSPEIYDDKDDQRAKITMIFVKLKLRHLFVKSDLTLFEQEKREISLGIHVNSSLKIVNHQPWKM